VPEGEGSSQRSSGPAQQQPTGGSGAASIPCRAGAASAAAARRNDRYTPCQGGVNAHTRGLTARSVANEGGEEVGGTLVRWQPVFPSDFPPPDAGLRRTGRNGQGCRVTAEAVDRLFVHVNGNSWDQEGIRGDPRGACIATCKIAGIAYTGSNPVPAT
jgi:hypothetical protein